MSSSDSDSSSSSPSPPPPEDSSSDSSPSPPPSNDSPSPPPPSDDSSSSPPPPSDDSSSSPSPSPPPPSSDDSNSPPPPPSDDKSSPPPPPPSDDKSPPPPPDNDSKDNNNNNKDKNDNDSPSRHAPPPPPRSGGHSRDSPRPALGNSPSDEGNDSSVLIGAAVAGGVLLLFMIACMVACCCRNKKRKRYYRDDSHGRNSYFTNSGQNWNNNGTGNDYMVKIPPQMCPPSGHVSSEHGWPFAPPPPPPMMSSSELSSAGFSSGPPKPPPHPSVALGFNQSSFTYEDLAAATSGFVQANLLGQGGFGFVHKGVLPNGKEIAVKSLKMNSGQGEREFQAEVDIISRVHHRHLVSLVGYCIAGSQRMLVYEFVPNGTLEYHLHGAGRPTMVWPTRLKIALGSAKGFAYLHEDCHPRIIHRDIKTANILLDNNFEAKVADFGLAKLSQDNYTHVSTRIMGTFGYLAPEYASSGKLTEKSDVYSFGIMLLELITGRRPIDLTSDDEDTLVDWARPILVRVTEGESFEELVDPRLGNNYDPQEMQRLVYCAAACIRHSARRRPRMSQIVRALEGDVSLDDLNAGVKGANGSLWSSNSSSDIDLKRLGKAGATSSQEFTGSEDGQTGEFGRRQQPNSNGNSQEIRSPNLGGGRTPHRADYL